MKKTFTFENFTTLTFETSDGKNFGRVYNNETKEGIAFHKNKVRCAGWYYFNKHNMQSNNYLTYRFTKHCKKCYMDLVDELAFFISEDFTNVEDLEHFCEMYDATYETDSYEETYEEMLAYMFDEWFDDMTFNTDDLLMDMFKDYL